MVYRYLVVSSLYSSTQPHGLDLNRATIIRTGIDTSILYVDKQIYKEASSILYSENIPYISSYPNASQHTFRKDKSKLTTRSLRSGRQCSMTKYSGRIYHHVLARFARIRIGSFFAVSANVFYITRQWNSMSIGLRDMLSELCQLNTDERWSQKRELVIAMTFYQPRKEPIDSALWARRFHNSMVENKTWEPLKEIIKDYVVRFEGTGPTGLIDSLKVIFNEEVGGLKVE